MPSTVPANDANKSFIPPALDKLPSAGPQTKADWAYAILVALGIDPNTHPGSVQALIAQQNAEGTTGALWNNPLAVGPNGKIQFSGTKTQNSDGVLSFQNWQDGLTANAIFMMINDPALVSNLQGQTSVQSYGKELESNDWEALGGSSNPLNVNYGAAVQKDASSGGGLSAGFAAISSKDLNNLLPVSVAPEDKNGNPKPDAGAAVSDTYPTLSDIFGININWTIVGGMALAIGLVLAGIYIMFHTQANAAVKTAVKGAVLE